MKLLRVALPVLLITNQALAEAAIEPSFATAASPAYEEQVLRGPLAPLDPAYRPAPPTLAASFAAASPSDQAVVTPGMASVSPVPEPSGLLLMATGFAAVLVLLSRRARREG